MAILARTQRTLGSTLRLNAPGPRILLLPAVAILIFVVGAAVLDLTFSGRAIPGVRVAGVEVGALDERGIRLRLEREAAGPHAAARVTATYAGRAVATTNGELGIRPDLDAAVAEALAYGRRGTPLSRLDGWLDALTGRASLAFAMRAEGTAARDWVEDVAAALERAPVSASIRRTAGGFEIVEAALGASVDRERLLASLTAPATLADREIAVPVRAVVPEVDAAGSRDAAALIRAATTPLDIVALDRTISEDAVGLATLIELDLLPGAAAGALPDGAVLPAERYRYVARIDETKARRWVAQVAAALDRPARDAGYAVRPDGALAVVPSIDGVRIEQDALFTMVLEELRRAVDGRRTITAPLVADRPAFATEDAERWKEALVPVASFETYFPPNVARYTNIRIGASLFDGVVVAPGRSLSFWSRFGADPAAKGFVPAGAIVNGRSDDSVVGGGLCQVSTTLFNAVANGGYEILERHPHGYLIERYPIGLDAAVFFPGLDMRWRNDTPYPVLLRTQVTPTSVAFTLLSVPGDREVAYGGPAQSNWVAVTPDLPPDPGHAPGYAVAGRDVLRTRVVTEAGNVIHRDTFFSRYIPVWGGPAASAATSP